MSGRRAQRDETSGSIARAELRPGSRVTVCGSVTRDVVHRHGRVRRQIGGTVWFAGTTLADLGLKVRVLTRLAAADQAIAEAFQGRRVETHLLPSRTTTTFHNIYGPGGRDDRRQRVEATAEPIPLSAVEAALAGADLCYLGALHPADLAPEAVAFLCHQREIPMAMDAQGFTRRIDAKRVAAEAAPDLAVVLAACRVIKASAFEACLITGETHHERAARRLGAATPGSEILVTCGRDGVLLARGDALHRQAAVPIDAADPTGAGDILLAAYLARRLGGAAPVSAVRFAVAHAARRLRAADRVVHLPD